MSIDDLPQLLKTKYFDYNEIEDKIRQYWGKNEIYQIDPAQLAENNKSIIIDTPPPYANGALHHGHGMSYTQLDILARYHRMRQPTLLPLAFDDNGLPTERYTEKKYEIYPGEHPDNFFELCKKEAKAGITTQQEQFDKMGFSYNHQISYRTIDDRTIRITQQDFIDLYEQGHIIRQKEPQLYCIHCQTALAQADLETKSRQTKMHYIRFPTTNIQNDSIPIGTTRPELIPAAIAIFYHPSDTRYEYDKLTILNPITNESLPLIADERVDPDQGSGILMSATFGDLLDIELYRYHQLPNRTIIDHTGKINYPGYEGQTIHEFREQIIDQLQDDGYWIKSESINQQIPICERCATPMEIIESEQWNLDILSIKEELLDYIDQINFHPSYMKKRLINWIKGLRWNWTISRQRYYGIPIPMYHCQDCSNTFPAEQEDLPIKPGSQDRKSCPKCKTEAQLDPDIFDTWMASSLTPRILADKYLNGKLSRPLAFRSQAHEIIRTWAFYTITKQYLSGEEQTIPWQDLLISGWGLGFKGKGKRSIKASKSSGGGKDPIDLINEYGADAFRYWAANARLGKDQHLLESTLNRGKKLVTKIYNAAKITYIMLFQIETGDKTDHNMTKHMQSSISKLKSSYNRNMKQFQYTDALSELEIQFWDLFCSKQIEEFKNKAYNSGLSKKEKQILANTWRTYLELLAPFLPFITEYLSYLSWQFSNQSDHFQDEQHNHSRYHSIHQQFC